MVTVGATLTYTLGVSNTMICSHVGVRLKTTHTRREDVRVTLVSPMGTRSVLQAINFHDAPGPVDWTYWSTLHYFESSAGDWRVDRIDRWAVLEHEVIPLFYERDVNGIPHGWCEKIKRSLMTLAPRFSATRMMNDYVERIYTAG